MFKNIISRFRKPEQNPGETALVPTALSVRDVYANASRGGPLSGLYSFSIGGSRTSALQFATLYRCITLVSSLGAQLITDGSLRVVDRSTGEVIDTTETRRIINMISSTPDGNTNGHTFFEDCFVDLCLSGNCLIGVNRVAGSARSLTRLNPDLASTTTGDDGSVLYSVVLSGNTGGPSTQVSSLDIIHARFPVTGAAPNGRDHFAAPVITALRPALEIGLAGDEYLRKHLMAGGAASNMIVSYEENMSADNLEKSNKRLQGMLTKGPSPIVLGNKANVSFSANNPGDADSRAFQVVEIARVFGIPPAIIGQESTAFGAAIESLSKGFYKFGMRQHVDRLIRAAEIRLLTADQRFEIDPTSLIRGDADATSKMIMALGGTAQNPAIADQRELRHIAGLPRDGGPEDRRVFGPAVGSGAEAPLE